MTSKILYLVVKILLGIVEQNYNWNKKELDELRKYLKENHERFKDD